MFIPLRSDCPVYHRPWATGILILVNVVLFFATLGMDEDTFCTYWVLCHGDGLTPLQWFTSAFSHAGIFHLLGNMLFLWPFGLIVEGKIGFFRFLGVYLGLAIVSGMLEQICFLGSSQSYSLGASTAITGIMTIAWLWAPRNSLSVLFLLGFFNKTFDVAIWIFCCFFIGWDLISAVILGFAMSTPLLHSFGFLVGLPTGLFLLRLGIANCEGWDAVTLWLRRLSGLPTDSIALNKAWKFAEIEAKRLEKKTEFR